MELKIPGMRFRIEVVFSIQQSISTWCVSNNFNIFDFTIEITTDIIRISNLYIIFPVEIRMIVAVRCYLDTINITFLTLSVLSNEFPTMEIAIKYVYAVEVSVISSSCPSSIIWSTWNNTNVSIVSSIANIGDTEDTHISRSGNFDVQSDPEVIIRNVSSYTIILRTFRCDVLESNIMAVQDPSSVFLLTSFSTSTRDSIISISYSSESNGFQFSHMII